MKTQKKYLTWAVIGLVLAGAGPARASEDLVPVDQHDLADMVADGQANAAFLEAFEAGDELIEHAFTQSAGVGANIGEGRLFTRIPRADLNGPGEWLTHFPAREGGANATSCIACHNAPIANGAGDVAVNVLVDPAHTGEPALYLERNTLPLFALAVPQRLAEEMTSQLMAQRDQVTEAACDAGHADIKLEANGVSFGTLSAQRIVATPCDVAIDVGKVTGVDSDLIVRPFGWKGNHASIRGFTRQAAHNELGLQAVELVGQQDGDFDGVTNELSVGDMTALTVYMAGLERPVSSLKLVDLGLVDMPEAQVARIETGEALFADVGCAGCHVPQMELQDAVFSEPSRTRGYFDETFPDGSDPALHGVSQVTAISMDLTRDQPNNRMEVGGTEHHLGALPVNDKGQAVAMWYTDFRRHDMGDALADPADPLGIGAAVFLTRSLAGVGSTGPWLHDGRATTLEAAILAHGGAADAARDAYVATDEAGRDAIVIFLESLVIHDGGEH